MLSDSFSSIFLYSSFFICFTSLFNIYKCDEILTQINNRQSRGPFSANFTLLKSHPLSEKEFEETYLSDLKSIFKASYIVEHVPLSKLRQIPGPKKLDWRNYLNYSVVTPVKNQKKCGGCWAFSIVETVESMVAIATGKPPPDLSVQEVIDCSYNNYGCGGGDSCMAAKWLKDAQAPVVSEKEYPLTDESNLCKMTSISPSGQKVLVKDYQCYSMSTGLTEADLLKLLQHGPVAAAVDARTWMNYQGGIIQYHCEGNVNHAVQIVGYDLTGDVPYYIVRNSWGPDFGHNGYLYIKVGANVCGIAHEITTISVAV